MLLHLATDGVPIYQQIVDQLRFRIVSGPLAVGDEMPTIRGLAEAIRVNPNRRCSRLIDSRSWASLRSSR
jgi:GntR family transcriptional regulator